MNSDVITSPPSYFSAARWLMGGLLALFALMVLRVAPEYGRRAELERTAELTAIGDVRYFVVTDPFPSTLGTFQGRPLLPVSTRHHDIRDSRMDLVGEDDSHLHRLYTTREPISFRNGETERKNEPTYFVKIGPEEYLRVQPGK